MGVAKVRIRKVWKVSKATEATSHGAYVAVGSARCDAMRRDATGWDETIARVRENRHKANALLQQLLQLLL